jgi:hypothetical protein
VDFNGDGIPEVQVHNSIFSLPTGNLLCRGTENNAMYCHAVDMTGDGKLDLCCGTQIYKVDIPDGGTTAGCGTMSVIRDMELTTLPAGIDKSGVTVVADIDNDGIKEVIVRAYHNGYEHVFYVWKPLPDNESYLMGSCEINAAVTGRGLHLVGNIDDDPYLEIVFISGNPYKINALKYDPIATPGNQIKVKWQMDHSDKSAITGISLFDFNLDGISEIVYRDETVLRIIDGSSSTPEVLSTFDNVSSGTLKEIPLIIDFDGDGEAEIVIQGHTTTTYAQNGYLRVFKSDGSKWAEARPVWNQYMYNAVNVNKDLTIPKIQVNLATLFPNNTRPYNAFLQQQTILDKNGDPFWPMPNIEWYLAAAPDSIPTFEYDGTDVTFFGCVKNIGGAALQAPVYVTFYVNETLKVNVPNNIIGIGTIQIKLCQGKSIVSTLHFPIFSTRQILKYLLVLMT